MIPITHLLLASLLLSGPSIVAAHSNIRATEAPRLALQETLPDLREPKLELVQAPTARPGRPWILAASGDGENMEVVMDLLEKGFQALVLVDLGEGQGAPLQRARIDALLTTMIAEHDLAPQGGLIAHTSAALPLVGLAADNPQRFTCMYLQDPVVDPKSWPAGLGRGKAAPDAWAECLRGWGITEEEARDSNRFPMERSIEVIEFGLPILVSTDGPDAIAPARENGLRFARRAKEGAGRVRTINRVKVSAEDSREIALQFMLQHVEGKDPYITPRAGLPGLGKALAEKRPIRMGFVGGDLTRRPGWAGFASHTIERRLQDSEVEWIGGGAPRCHVAGSALRFEHDLLVDGPLDVLFVECGLPERRAQLSDVEMRRGLEGIVRRARAANPDCDIVLMHFLDTQSLAVLRGGGTPSQAKVMEAVAEHYGLPTLSIAREMVDRMDEGELEWKQQFGDDFPRAMGHRLYARALDRFLTREQRQGFPAHVTHQTPPEPMDAQSYDNGVYVDLSELTLDDGWESLDPWLPVEGENAYPDYADVPVVEATTAGSTLSFQGKGRAVGLLVIAGPDAGQIDVRIDGGEWTRHELFVEASQTRHLPRWPVLATGLDPDVLHTVEVRVADEHHSRSRGTRCRIMAATLNR
jgi:sialidase-1